jgi:hypothetical protein
MRNLFLLLSLALSLAACGGGYEGTVTYQVHFKPEDVTGSTLAEDDHVDPTDVQWRAFLNQAQASLEQAPTQFEVTGVRMQLDPTRSRNVGVLEDLFTGDVVLFVRASEVGTQVDVAEQEDPKGGAQVDMDLTDKSLEPLYGDLARGDFRVGLRGGTPKTSTGDFEAAVTLTLDVTASK